MDKGSSYICKPWSYSKCPTPLLTLPSPAQCTMLSPIPSFAPFTMRLQNPALDPAASEVFFLVSEQNGPSITVDSLLAKLRVPLLLLWGDLDPWITPARADKIQALYPSAERVGLQAGHCPHDDTPEQANDALLSWLAKLQ